MSITDVGTGTRNGSSSNTLTHIHLDAVGGVAGDMFVASLLDALPDLRSRVVEDVLAVLPAGCGRVEVLPGTSCGLRVLRFGLREEIDSDHNHHRQFQTDHHRGGVVTYPELVSMISRTNLSEGTADHALAIFALLAKAESHTHGVALDEVHFHEIADWDSLIDIVAAGSIASALEGVTWSVSVLPTGSGLVSTRHGYLPVPVPAAVELLEGFKWRDDGVEGERVTPTGAAILAHLVNQSMPTMPSLKLVASGTGAGDRELSALPNVLRSLLYAMGNIDDTCDEIAVLSFDIDDMTAEEISVAAERLRTLKGVVDLSVGQRSGKKGRYLNEFRILINPLFLVQICDSCFLETTTIGLRWHKESRRCLARKGDDVSIDETSFRIKRTQRPNGLVTAKVESDCLVPVEGLFNRRQIKNVVEK